MSTARNSECKNNVKAKPGVSDFQEQRQAGTQRTTARTKPCGLVWGAQRSPKTLSGLQRGGGDPAPPATAQGETHEAGKRGGGCGLSASLCPPPARPRGERGSRNRTGKLQLGGGNETAEG